MQTTLTTTPGRHDHPPQPTETLVQVRRVGALDRLALHVGIALIAWGRRPLTVEIHERRANRVELDLARLECERAREDALRISSYPR